MSEILSKNIIKERGANLFLLILTLSMLSFFAFGNNRLGAFLITFLISFLSLSVLLFYVYKKERANFELRKKDNIDKLMSLIKEPAPAKCDENIEVQEYSVLHCELNLRPNIKQLIWRDVNVNLKDRTSVKLHYAPQGMKRHNYIFEHIDLSHNTVLSKRMGIDYWDSSLPTVLNRFGEILDNDNGIEIYRYTDKDVNNLIMKMNICMQNIQGRYIHNQYSKEITVILLQSAIDYLKEKHNIPIYGNTDPYLPQFK